jgi:hypothetical protein
MDSSDSSESHHGDGLDWVVVKRIQKSFANLLIKNKKEQ